MIKVDALSRMYGHLAAVDNVSFEIGRGEIVGLLGHNGAGKTTIMKMLTGYLEPTGGSILIDGLDISAAREAVQQIIGYLPENDPLYSEMTVIDYLDYAAALHGITSEKRAQRIHDAIDKTALADKATDIIATLSRGYRQRVGVAQAILHHPKLLILDEPTNGLDPTQVQQMRELIRSLARQATVILSTHILHEVQAICDRVIIIRNGHKALDATMQELRAGKRLLVSLDAAPEQAIARFNAISAVQSVEQVSAQGAGYRYALDLHNQSELAETAAMVAAQVISAGWKLYALQPESRDLETVFAEISGSKTH
ncbi:MAG: ABC transporter ATP-binding protein [Nitrosomonas sp.]|nr:ABC transporter ATP-binding protein [Nitrosomonas sp.]